MFRRKAINHLFERRTTGRFVPYVIAAMVYLAALAGAVDDVKDAGRVAVLDTVESGEDEPARVEVTLAPTDN